MHSVGVAKIVWNFSRDTKQTIAGLLHDIATPVFAHTIDFLNGDHLAQETTEDKTLQFIENSKEIRALLKEYHVCVEEISDYHMYPIADNDTPMLSADRLEYTLGNGFCVYHMEQNYLKSIYSDLIVTQNENGEDELCFQTIRAATDFTQISLRNSRLFVSDEDRYSMQHLADIIKCAIDNGVLTLDDLYLTEYEVISRLIADEKLSILWKRYSEISAVTSSSEKLGNQYCVNVSAKKRYINPLVLVGNSAMRLTDLDDDMRNQIQSFLDVDFNKWLYAV